MRCFQAVFINLETWKPFIPSILITFILFFIYFIFLMLVIIRLQRTNRSPGPGAQPAGRNSPGNPVTSMVNILSCRVLTKVLFLIC